MISHCKSWNDGAKVTPLCADKAKWTKAVCGNHQTTEPPLFSEDQGGEPSKFTQFGGGGAS